MNSRMASVLFVLRLIWTSSALSMVVASAEAAITLEQLQQQAAVTSAAHLQYSIAWDEQNQLVSQAEAAWNRWQSLTELAVLYYGGGDYVRGDYYQLAAVKEQIEYDRLMALIPPKMNDVENKWQAYRREFERLQAMLAAYRSQK